MTILDADATYVLKTQNSTYEIKPSKKLIRRVNGVNPPTGRFGEDGVWHEYDRTVRLDDNSVAVFWNETAYTWLTPAQDLPDISSPTS